MENAELISAVCNIVTAFAAVFAAWLAKQGVTAWRKQLVGQDEFDIAKRILKGAFEAESLIGRIRQYLKSKDHVSLWNRFDEVAAELDFAFLEGRVLWGDALVGLKAKLKECVVDLRLSTRWLNEIEQKRKAMSEEQYEKLHAKHDPIVWTQGDDDPFTGKLHDAVTALENKLRPHLKR